MAQNNRPDQFETALRAALQRSVADIHPHGGLAARLRAQLVYGGRIRSHASTSSLRPLRSGVAAFVVITLLVSAFAILRAPALTSVWGTWFGNGQRTVTPPMCDQTNDYVSVGGGHVLVDLSTAIAASATVNGATLTVDRAYADATQTVVTFHLTPASNGALAQAVLSDASGARYWPIVTSYSTAHQGRAVFAPLPHALLGTLQTVTFTLPQKNQSATPVAQADEPWRVSFDIATVAPVTTSLTTPAQTYGGITIQPEQIEIASAGGGVDGQNDGARILLRISGLPADMPLYAAGNFIHYFQVGAGGASTGGCGGRLALQLPDGRQIKPGFVLPVGQYAPTSSADLNRLNSQTVGASGTVEVQALFFAPLDGVSAIQLEVDQVPVWLLRQGQARYVHAVNGPWRFDLSVQASKP